MQLAKTVAALERLRAGRRPVRQHPHGPDDRRRLRLVRRPGRREHRRAERADRVRRARVSAGTIAQELPPGFQRVGVPVRARLPRPGRPPVGAPGRARRAAPLPRRRPRRPGRRTTRSSACRTSARSPSCRTSPSGCSRAIPTEQRPARRPISPERTPRAIPASEIARHRSRLGRRGSRSGPSEPPNGSALRRRARDGATPARSTATPEEAPMVDRILGRGRDTVPRRCRPGGDTRRAPRPEGRDLGPRPARPQPAPPADPRSRRRDGRRVHRAPRRPAVRRRRGRRHRLRPDRRAARRGRRPAEGRRHRGEHPAQLRDAPSRRATARRCGSWSWPSGSACPIVTFVDVPGAHPGPESEERGIAEIDRPLDRADEPPADADRRRDHGRGWLRRGARDRRRRRGRRPGERRLLRDQPGGLCLDPLADRRRGRHRRRSRCG